MGLFDWFRRKINKENKNSDLRNFDYHGTAELTMNLLDIDECVQISLYPNSKLPDYEGAVLIGDVKKPHQYNLLINKDIEEEDLIAFVMAHEIRHVWQKEYCPALLENYIELSQNGMNMTVEEHNLQPAEVDANAFAILITRFYFYKEFEWENYNQETKDRFYELVEEYKDRL